MIYIRTNKNLSPTIIAQQLNRNEATIKSWMNRLGVVTDTTKKLYSKNEDILILKLFPIMRPAALADLLCRSVDSINGRAKLLRVTPYIINQMTIKTIRDRCVLRIVKNN